MTTTDILGENPIAADAETAIRRLAAGASRQARARALELAAAGLADNRDSSIWEILYAAEWVLGDFTAASYDEAEATSDRAMAAS